MWRILRWKKTKDGLECKNESELSQTTKFNMNFLRNFFPNGFFTNTVDLKTLGKGVDHSHF